MTDTSARILLLGTHGQHNIGDELLLETFLSQLGERNSYVINTYDKADTAARLGTRYRYELIDTAGDRRSLLRHLRRADLLVFAGGSILKELSAATGRPRYATMAMILALVCAARWLGSAPVAMLNIGVGPIRTRRGRFLARRILNGVDLVTVRDAASSDLCAQIGTTTEVISSTDAVFSVTPTWLRGGGAEARRDSSGPLRIALNLNHDIEVPANWAYVLETLGAALSRLAQHRPIEVHALPMQSRGKQNDDATVLRQFASANPDVTVIEHLPRTHSDVARIIGSCDVVVAERLHALISSAKLGIPIIPLVYDVKVRELAVALGVDALAIDLSRSFSVEDVIRSLTAVADDRASAAAALADRVSVLTDRARTGFDSARAWVRGRGR
jgi:polysaccharide pyruvyl transferase WcaK-like protein